jgi:hypothetical protein
MKTPAFRKIPCKDWDHLIVLLDSLPTDTGAEWIHRAQRRASWELTTTFERHAVDLAYEAATAEGIWRKEFERRAHFYLSPQHVPNDKVEWLALMQHFGAPTRLLDFTRSPYVASYFALEDQGEEANCAVWSINKDWCRQAAGNMLRDDPENAKTIEILKPSVGADPARLGLPMMITMEQNAKLFAAWVLKRNPTMVLPIEPYRLSERLSIQQGTFLCTGNARKPFMENLTTMHGWQDNVIKFTLSFDQRGRALEKMRQMNITRATLFPGLDGFAQSFRQHLVREPLFLAAIRAMPLPELDES